MYPPIRISWLLDLLPVVIGNIRALPLEDRNGGLPVPIGRELVFVQKPVGSKLIPVHRVLVEVEHIPSLALAGNRPVLPPAPTRDVQILSSVAAGRIRGLLLA